MIENKNCKDEWLDVMLFKVLEKIPAEKAKIEAKGLKMAYEACKKHNNDKWAEMVLEYAKKTNQSIE